MITTPDEPVVWIQPDHLAHARKAPFLCRVAPGKRDDFVPLYAHPPADAMAQDVQSALEEAVLDVVALLDVVGEETHFDLDGPEMDYFITVSKNIGFLRALIDREAYFDGRYKAYKTERGARRGRAG